MIEHISTVCMDDEQGAYDMTRHILGLGHRAVGFIGGQAGQSSARERLRGHKRAMVEEGRSDQPEHFIVEGDFSYRSGLAAAERLLRLERRPTAIFASNDDTAAAVIAAANRMSLRVPQDLTVCGFDDSEMATTVWPELTTIHQPIQAMARAGVGFFKTSSGRRTRVTSSRSGTVSWTTGWFGGSPTQRFASIGADLVAEFSIERAGSKVRVGYREQSRFYDLDPSGAPHGPRDRGRARRDDALRSVTLPWTEFVAASLPRKAWTGCS